uniref:non-specific serine/threonine protein kinase n=1 Tax=Davidia involucrata TaxID=16924 RepID=A0A5B7C875_DAVIN
MAKWAIIMLYMALVWWCYFTNTGATSFPNETDLNALMAFKAAINQDPFGALSSWNDTLHLCDWKGVLCSGRHRVIVLDIRSQGLVGSLSPHIGNLSFLKRLILQNNSFHGQIPQEIGRLFRLQTIEFSNNSFSGQIPNNLSLCSNLHHLNLTENHLTGIIPPELGSLSKLVSLGLGKNKLSGTIPRFIGNLSSLSRISLGYCDFEGEIPEEIAKLWGLRFIQLISNKISGEIPSGLYNISTLSLFSVGHNQLRGSIPPDIGLTLPNLRFLELGHNWFTGMIPISLSNASGLKVIDFNSNVFTGPLPKGLGRLLGLQSMSFFNNLLQDDFSFISSLTNCTTLQEIEISRNLLRGSLPNSIGNLSTYIRCISMAENQLEGSIPSSIENLLNLIILSMSWNYLTGPIPMSIGKLHKLKQVYLGMNSIGGKLPSSLGNLSMLNHLFLGQNHIYGSIPESLGKCGNLLELDLSRNNLSGLIPKEIMSLSSISISLSLAHNALTGSLPSEVGSLRDLVNLDVSNNNLLGFLPHHLSNCLSLQWLHLEGNSFKGKIPRGLGALRGLRELDLSRNKFSGKIPNYLGELLGLEKLGLSNNSLHGEVPIQGVFQNASRVSIIGNNGLCGGIADLNLPPCPSNKLSHMVKVIIPVVIFVVICFDLLFFFFIFLYWRRISRKKGSSMPSLFKHHFLRISYAELLKATDGFSQTNLIGFGSYGSVYKGILNQIQTVVAVKVLNLQAKGASKSFISECKALKSIRHRNLLKILSVCSSVDFQGNDFKALVYEFMANGSLEKWLHPDGQHEDSKNLQLIQRVNIAIEIASALEYLHCHNESSIVHGDLKPSNVLLDDDMTAHVGDFGLAKVISTISTDLEQHQSTSVAIKGTIGYVAPEYGTGDMVSTHGDVYSYGILLLEMFTGKKPTDDTFKDDVSLHNFVKCALPNQVMEIVDPRILEHETTSRFKDCMVSILRIGVACSMELPRDRVQMGDVVSELHKTRNVYTNEVLSQN